MANWVRTLSLLVLLVAEEALSFSCSSVNRRKCLCQQLDTNSIQCPPADPKISIFISSKHHISMQCLDAASPSLDLDLIPNINISQCQQFKMEFCFLDSGFDSVMKKFSIQNLTELELDSMAPADDVGNFSLTKESLGELRHLQSLRISYSPIDFDPDFLANSPDLLVLVLHKNKISQLQSHFDHVPKLKLLDLSLNQISALPDGLFRALTNLSKLYIFNNNVSAVSRSTFQGLHSLQLLELSLNHINQLAEDSFTELPRLINLSLRGNQIQIIQSHIFANNPLLENVRLGMNPGLVMQDTVFGNLTKLRTVELNFNQLLALPERTFEGCHSLVEVNLNDNLLSKLPEDVFQNLSNLKRLYLSNNKLNALANELFASLDSLEELDLSNNQLTDISRQVFKPLYKLRTLHLEQNQLSVIDRNAFSSLEYELTYLNLSCNKWNNSYEVPIQYYEVTPLIQLIKIEELIVSHNQLRWIPDLPSALKLRRFDLSYNNITNVSFRNFVTLRGHDLEIDVSHNQIEQLDFQLAETTLSQNLDEGNPEGFSNIFTLSNNPLVCDCRNYDLARFNNNDMKNMKSVIRIELEDQVCADDSTIKVAALTPSQVSCSVAEGCPAGCSCTYKPFANAAAVNCAFQNLSFYPNLDTALHPHINQTWLILRGNNFTRGPSKEQALRYYSNVTQLDLSENALTGIGWIPPQIEVLNLSNNSIQNLDGNFVRQLKNSSRLRRLHLKNNPWQCSCQSLDLQKYIMQFYHKINTSEVFCRNSHMELVKMTDLCKVSAYLSVMLPIVLSVLLCFSVAIALYYRYQTEIKVYLFAKSLCLWFVTEEELDKDKTYDVFVSYAHQDETFVVESLLPVLEQRENPFKVCIHIRDWIPGEFIAEQVVNSVRDSRRTLVVLSNNFVDSVWGKMEFRAAHTEAISEGRARVIVVIYGDLDESKLDEELKSYLKTNTYVKWGDRYFWNKLKYALPHSHGHFYEKNKRHANVMLKIDDQFDLIKTPPSPSNTSTPPITLDPALLQSKGVIGPVEGEAPLLVRT